VPVPWARDAASSFLERPETVRALIEGIGLRLVDWADVTASGLEWIRARLAGGTPPAVGLHLLMGPDAPAMQRNLLQNLEEQRIVLVQGVFERP
jgi:hypothetical protein